MQCVILAAGKGSRMMPLTAHTPKPLIVVCGKPILDHILEALPKVITEIILVTNYLEEQIKERYGTMWNGKDIKYVTQINPAGGTGDALLCAKELITDRFLVLNGDDIHGAAVLEQSVVEGNSLLVVNLDNPELFGVVETNQAGYVKKIVEKPASPISNLVNTGGFVADKNLFNYVVEISDMGELYATDMLTAFAQDHAVKVIEQTLWVPIGSPQQLQEAEVTLCGGGVDSAG